MGLVEFSSLQDPSRKEYLASTSMGTPDKNCPYGYGADYCAETLGFWQRKLTVIPDDTCQPCPPPRGALGPSDFPSALTDSARVRTLINQCQARHRQQGRHSSAALQPHTSHCPGPIQMARKQPMQHIKEMRQK